MNIILPTEVLTKIVCQCNNPAISEACKTFAAVTLGARILRSTKGAMLTVCIGLITERTKEVSALCELLAEYNARIREFALTAHTVFLAVLSMMSFRTWSRSEVFSILSESESSASPEYARSRRITRGRNRLSHAPQLESLWMEYHFECVAQQICI